MDEKFGDFVTSFMVVALGSKELHVNYPPSLAQDLLDSATTKVISLKLIEWADMGSYIRQDDWNIELDGIIQLIDLRVLELQTPIVRDFIFEMLLLFLQQEHDQMSVVKDIVVSFLIRVGPRVIVALLGIRTTIGCIENRLPPRPSELLEAFDKPHKILTGSKLSVGARALSKHFHRGTEGWWGASKGNDDSKNLSAHVFCEKIIKEAVWINLHQIVGGVNIVEYRVREGYGARWALVDHNITPQVCLFRGFLEPHCLDGHDKGWRH